MKLYRYFIRPMRKEKHTWELVDRKGGRVLDRGSMAHIKSQLLTLPKTPFNY